MKSTAPLPRPDTPRTARPWHGGTLVAALLTTLALLLGTAAPGQAEPGSTAPASPAATAPASPAATAPATQLTLITGDVVSYLGTGDSVTVVQYADGTGTVEVYDDLDGVYAVPDQAVGLIAAGTLDRQLFNVTSLVEQGYGDAESAALPVIVSYDPADQLGAGRGPAEVAALAQRAARLPAAADPVGLPSVNGAAVEVDKAAAGDFWQGLTGPGSEPDSPMATLDAATEVERVWLDQQVTVALDESVGQVGAPAAWDLGFDGTGVTIAVLDTGYDPDHPDLAGKVVTAENFISGETVVDGHGHGTHVAATAAGTGAASGGDYPGVAPGADLVVAKVLSDTGSGPVSGIIEGMEWAVGQGADVINMSLGACCSDGTDPISQAVDALSAQSGALFVIAAGNNGPSAHSITAPGAAASALTVGAVDKSDQLASFSSRGPLRNTFAIKPDLVAPGVGIAAARAAGTTMGTPVNEHYTRANGTSMAAPHAAGAAAVLAQRFPDWDAAQLKAALMSSTAALDDSAFQVGSGRLDVARAATQTVFATSAAVDFGLREWPHDTPPESRTVTYHNAGDEPVTLALALAVNDGDGNPAPAGLVTVDAGTVIVAPGGTTDVTVSLHEQEIDGAAGLFSGLLVATGPTGQTVHTALGAFFEEEHFDVTVEVLVPEHGTGWGGGPGLCGNPRIQAFNLNAWGGIRELRQTSNCWYEGRLTAGAHHFWTAERLHVDGRSIRLQGILPEEDITSPTHLVIDLSDLTSVKLDVPRPAEHGSHMVGWSRGLPDGGRITSRTLTSQGVHSFEVAPTPTDPVTQGWFNYFLQPVLTEQWVRMQVAGDPSIVLTPEYVNRQLTFVGGQLQLLAGAGQRELVDAGAGSAQDFADLDVAGRFALVEVAVDWDHNSAIVRDAIAEATAAGAAGVLIFSKHHYPAVSHLTTADHVPAVHLPSPEGRQLKDALQTGPVTIAYQGVTQPSYTYTIRQHFRDVIPPVITVELVDGNLVAVDTRMHGLAATVGAHIYDVLEHGRAGGAGAPLNVPGSAQYTSYIGPTGQGLAWERRVSSGNLNWVQLDAFDTPGSRVEHWGLPVIPPAVPQLTDETVDRIRSYDSRLSPPLCPACRQGDDLKLFFQTTDGTTDRLETLSFWAFLDLFPEEFRPQRLTLTANGVEVPLTYQLAPFYQDLPGDLVEVPSFELPAQTSQVELRQQLDMGTIWPSRPYGTEMDTSWRFTSERRPPGAGTDHYACADGPGCHPERLIFLSYDLRGLGLDNTAKAGEPFTFRVLPHYQQGVGAADLEVEVEASFDDGDSWEAAEVTPATGGYWQVTVTHPMLDDSTGAVTLRTTATDQAGGSIEQTLQRAYGLSNDPLYPDDPVGCDRTIDGSHSGPLLVAEGVTCLAAGSRVLGPVTVRHGAGLVADDATVHGPVSATGASVVELRDTRVAGPLRIDATTGHLLLAGNQLAGPVSLRDNHTGEIAIVVSGNWITGPLSCVGNEPPPVDAGDPNTVTGRASGQCAGW